MTDHSQQLNVLKQHFPNCFDKNGAFLPDKLQAIVEANGGQVSSESYALNWLGKSYARLLANEAPRTLLQADAAHNAQPEHAASQNLLIQGDNLEVLKHLKGAYRRQVKMIYIDPPYNTGSDGFVYQDDRKFTPTQLSHLAGINEDEARRILDFTSRKSNSHSAWLTFMYPRLYIARELLRDDGVIFISIDDNEQAQLKLLCDEVFGEENFLAEAVWEKIHSTKNDAKYLSDNHEYVLIYSKNINDVSVGLLARTEEMNKRYTNPDNDPRGNWASGDLIANEERREGYYEVVSPSGLVFNVPKGKHWVYSKENMLGMVADNRIFFGVNGTAFPRLKRFLSEVQQGKKADTLWTCAEVGHNQEAKREVKKIFGDVGLFETPKPIKFLRRMLELICKKTDNDLILDFFAGSGTTAHAVMQLNAEDGGNRRFICVQLDEATDPKSEAHMAGYPTIFDITRARISKAAAKIRTDYPDCAVDLGCKVFQTVPIFDGYLDEAEELTPNLELFNADTFTEADRANLLLTWAVQDGIALIQALTPVDLAGYRAYQGGEAGRLLYFIHPDLSLAAVIELLRRLDDEADFAPKHLIIWGYGVDSKTLREMTEAVAHYTNRKSILLDLDVRF